MKVLENLKRYDILLASKSPRRRELLQMLRVPFKVVTLTGIDETYPDAMPAGEVPEYLARHKAEAYTKYIRHNDLLITADTLVMLGGRIFGKPHDAAEAVAMLEALSGRVHQVVTGVCLSTRSRLESFSVTTDVHFDHLTAEEIDYYVENFQPFDKAGAYGIQEWIGAVAVSRLEGSYYNVMGLPVHRLYEVLKTF